MLGSQHSIYDEPQRWRKIDDHFNTRSSSVLHDKVFYIPLYKLPKKSPPNRIRWHQTDSVGSTVRIFKDIYVVWIWVFTLTLRDSVQGEVLVYESGEVTVFLYLSSFTFIIFS